MAATHRKETLMGWYVAAAMIGGAIIGILWEQL